MKKVAVIYGGRSSEHDISIKSAQYIINNLNREKYSVSQILIDKDGVWYLNNNEPIKDIVGYLRGFDVVFPVLHGLYGEDGTIQGMLELFNIPYVGCGILASSICMDKFYSKIIFDRCNIKNAKSVYLQYISKNKYIYFDKSFNEKQIEFSDLELIINENLNYPFFVKPSRSGSSIGVSKVENINELQNAIEIASKYDCKILIEQGIIGKEVEVAVLGNSKKGVTVSKVGEILSAEEFYSFSSKYENANSKTQVPASISNSQSELIQKYAKQLFIAVDGNGLSRIDFFVENSTGDIYINEINTLPGFTNISMYPILMTNYGFSGSELIDSLIELAK